MHLHEAFDEIERLRENLNGQQHELSFEDEKHFENRPFADCLHDGRSYNAARRRSGVFFVLDDDETVLYIGKAERNNLYTEIRRHLLIRPCAGPETNVFISKAVESPLVRSSFKKKLLGGSLRAAYVTISPSGKTALVAAHLLACCKKMDDSLPQFNSAEAA